MFVVGCSVIGENNVETAPYELLQSATLSSSGKQIEVRSYAPMVLVSTSMNDDSGNSAFRKLFKYITGANEGATEIAMTAPVIMDNTNPKKQGTEIAMTAPVFMDESTNAPTMSFVMPKDFTLATTPKPTNPDVWVSEVTQYKVVAIQFSGTLSNSNVEKHTKLLQQWMTENGFSAKSQPVKAGYNGPLTLPMWRRNEVLIEIN